MLLEWGKLINLGVSKERSTVYLMGEVYGKGLACGSADDIGDPQTCPGPHTIEEIDEGT